MGGCTDCGKKGGCDTRKGGMFAAIDQALALLYPTRRWGERDEAAALGAGVAAEEAEALAAAIGARTGALAHYRPGEPDEWCDYIYVLCLGRTPAIVQIRDDPRPRVQEADEIVAAETRGRLEDGAADGLQETYLRVALSSLTRFAGVQEVAMTLEARDGQLIVTERARAGVFDPVLLPRMQGVVAVLTEWNIRHVDFGEIMEAPAGFEAPDYEARFGAAPVIANYLFYPQPPTTVATAACTAAFAVSSSA